MLIHQWENVWATSQLWGVNTYIQLIRKTCATGDTSGVECFIYWENFTNLWSSERLSGWVSLSVAMFSKSRVSSLEFVFGPCLSVYPQPHHKKVQLAAAFVQSESESPAHSSSAKTVEQLHSSEVWTPSLQLIRKTCATRDTSGVFCKNEKTLQICEILSSWAAECSYVSKSRVLSLYLVHAFLFTHNHTTTGHLRNLNWRYLPYIRLI